MEEDKMTTLKRADLTWWWILVISTNFEDLPQHRYAILPQQHVDSRPPVTNIINVAWS